MKKILSYSIRFFLILLVFSCKSKKVNCYNKDIDRISGVSYDTEIKENTEKKNKIKNRLTEIINKTKKKGISFLSLQVEEEIKRLKSNFEIDVINNYYKNITTRISQKAFENEGYEFLNNSQNLKSIIYINQVVLAMEILVKYYNNKGSISQNNYISTCEIIKCQKKESRKNQNKKKLKEEENNPKEEKLKKNSPVFNLTKKIHELIKRKKYMYINRSSGLRFKKKKAGTSSTIEDELDELSNGDEEDEYDLSDISEGSEKIIKSKENNKPIQSKKKDNSKQDSYLPNLDNYLNDGQNSQDEISGSNQEYDENGSLSEGGNYSDQDNYSADGDYSNDGSYSQGSISGSENSSYSQSSDDSRKPKKKKQANKKKALKDKKLGEVYDEYKKGTQENQGENTNSEEDNGAQSESQSDIDSISEDQNPPYHSEKKNKKSYSNHEISYGPYIYGLDLEGLGWMNGEIKKCSKTHIRNLIKSVILEKESSLFTSGLSKRNRLKPKDIEQFLQNIYKKDF